MKGLSLLKLHGVAFNILTVVHSENVRHPKDVYRFPRDIGAEHIQFIPFVERSADGETLASAPQIDEDGVDYSVTPWSVLPRAYGAFLCAVFDEWVRHDVGRIFVQFFDVQLGLAMGHRPACAGFPRPVDRDSPSSIMAIFMPAITMSISNIALATFSPHQ